MSNEVSIYALFDPDSREVRYVGRSKDPERRYRQHLKSAKPVGTKKQRWIYGLKLKGKSPEYVILDTCPKSAQDEVENAWMNLFDRTGARLTNSKRSDNGSFAASVPNQQIINWGCLYRISRFLIYTGLFLFFFCLIIYILQV